MIVGFIIDIELKCSLELLFDAKKYLIITNIFLYYSVFCLQCQNI